MIGSIINVYSYRLADLPSKSDEHFLGVYYSRLIVVARPLAVQLCCLPFIKVSWKKRLFISCIGLKGAVPIVLALIAATPGVDSSVEMTHMVFFVVLFSVLLQGRAIELLAKKLGLVKNEQ